MIDWSAVENSAGSLLSTHAAAARWKHGALSFVDKKGLSQCQNIEVQHKEMLIVHESSAWFWEWYRLKLGYTPRHNTQREPCRGLVPTIMKKCKDHKINIRAPRSCTKTSNQVAQSSSQEQMTHSVPCKKAEV